MFLDRDGVLNKDTGYVHQAGAFEWLDGAREAIKWLNDGGFYVFVVTNQSGVARGLFTEDDVVALHQWIEGELASIAAHIDAFRYCPHLEEAVRLEYRKACPCRKPGAGMITGLLETWPVERERSFLVGDSSRDLEAAAKAGIQGFQFGGGNLATFLRGHLGQAVRLAAR